MLYIKKYFCKTPKNKECKIVALGEAPHFKNNYL